MNGKLRIKIGEAFKPAPQFKKLCYIYLLFGILVGILSLFIALLFVPFDVTLRFSAPILGVLVFIAVWIPKYYESMVYKLTEHEITWRRGVWFQNTGIVPYNRITNIDITQGPISRMLGIAALKIQTAGYSGQQARTEIRIEGMEQFEELRELIMEFVKGKNPVAVETYEEDTTDLRILNELVKIRELLESFSKIN